MEAAVPSQQLTPADIDKARNVLEKVTLESVRSLQSKDAQGNMIGSFIHKTALAQPG